MGEAEDEFEPLFDYSRVQPLTFVDLEDVSDSPPFTMSKKKKPTKPSNPAKTTKKVEVVTLDGEEEEDWLAPPPKSPNTKHNFDGDSLLMELRLRRQELASLAAQSADEVLRKLEESARSELHHSFESGPEPQEPCSPKLPKEREKVVIAVQDKDGSKQFRTYKDDKFAKLFTMYAAKVNGCLESMSFSFDGDKISPTASPFSLGMEDNDIIEVHIRRQ
ncbi:hypothetical protein AMTRI_Chr13g117870 [Amborella trichopoda]